MSATAFYGPPRRHAVKREMIAAASADLPLDSLTDEMIIDGMWGAQAMLVGRGMKGTNPKLDYTNGATIK